MHRAVSHHFASTSRAPDSGSTAARSARHTFRCRTPSRGRGRAAALQELLDAVPVAVPEAVPDNVQTWQQAASTPNLLAGSEPLAAPLRIALLLSGGVDSSLALRLLQEAGHEVTAFYLQIWFQDDFRNFWSACPWEEDLAVCEAVCQQAGVQLNKVPLTQQYWDSVVSSALSDIRAGLTPNPDMLCNSRVKFGAFAEYIQTHHSSRFDRIGTGHYGLIERSLDSQQPVGLRMTPDKIKDQTYFLAGLSQQQLARCIFPLGCLTKGQVRGLAAAAQLPNRSRPDSQGICFLGHVRFPEFVKQHLGTWPGPLLEEETGELVGVHGGVWFFTPGQRRGILLPGGPWYVSRKDLRRNAVFISRQYYAPEKLRRCFWCEVVNWCSGARPALHESLHCKVRHGPGLYAAHITDSLQQGGKELLQVQLNSDDQGLAPGQYAVFYCAEVCLGAAVIRAAPVMQDQTPPELHVMEACLSKPMAHQ